MRSPIIAVAGVLVTALAAGAGAFHVATGGNDANPGTAAAPFRTIQHAADLAQPGDIITIHQGIYRERINPPRGGESDAQRIVYQGAADEGDTAEIRGSEVVRNWAKVQDDTWKVTLPNTFFGGFNPYADLIHGDWFDRRGRDHHTGAVYLNGEWLTEAAKLDDVLKPAAAAPLWFGQVDKDNTTLWAQFKGADPNEQTVEINVRRTVFYPDKPGRNYITVRGLALRHAATPWAPPTAEQIGLIGTHWSKGWIIENNVVSHSVCSGIALGKHGDEFDNTSANTAEGYVKTIERGTKAGWSKENIGHHLVRNNTVSHCEQAGIVGSLGPIFCTVTGNTIHDIHVRRLFSGAEMAGIKFHGAIDTEISGNHIYRTCRGLWLDWMAQGTRVSGNLFHDNAGEDVFVEVDHGPFLLDNNFMLSRTSLLNVSEGGAYVHNLIAGRIVLQPELNRDTPFHPAHSTVVAGLRKTVGGDDRYYNNIFAGGNGLAAYDNAKMPSFMDGNVFLKGAKASKLEKDPAVKPDADPAIKVVQKDNGWYLEMQFDKAWATGRTRQLVTTDLLAKAAVPNVAYERPDGAPIRVTTDYLGQPRNQANPTPGPLENPGAGELSVKLR
ncbi:MAG: right-handed parallel beta-helix repeat-containing protein [Tepidisphaerales bacterium]